MKIIECDDEVMKVYVTEDYMVRMEFEEIIYDLTDNEARQLAEALQNCYLQIRSRKESQKLKESFQEDE